jgi:predicted GNAT superfamily acetyltransferase
MGIEVRALHDRAEFAQAVELQRIIWGFEDVDLLPERLFVIAPKVGGQAFGAFDGLKMIGFCLAIPGIKSDSIYLHSHMLGVLKEYRDASVGRMLKLAQRDDALSRGIKLIEWTFDPLDTTSSALHAGLPTDRCVAEWHIASPRVDAILAGRQPERFEEIARIAVPSTIYELKANDVQQARGVQRRVSAAFLDNVARGLAVTHFERTPDSGSYIFSPPLSPHAI